MAGGDVKSLYLAFGLTPRKVGKDDLQLNGDDLADAERIRPGWRPVHWSVDQAARMLLLLALPAPDASSYVRVLDQLFAAGEVHELVALYQALPLLPHPAAHALRTAEGVRSNIRTVFCAVAHDNPYPMEQLDDDAWNQLVLKCLFVGVSLSPVIGIDRRANRALAQMLLDYAHERQAAKRPVSPELWRCVGPFADGDVVDELAELARSRGELERMAAALALSASLDPRARVILSERAELSDAVRSGRLTWTYVSERMAAAAVANSTAALPSISASQEQY